MAAPAARSRATAVLSAAAAGLLLDEIADRIEQHAIGGEPVASGSAGFLLIIFERFGERGVNHEAHVGFVNAHSKGDSGDDDLALVAQERLLRFAALFVVHSGVIGSGFESRTGKFVREFFSRGAGEAIDDSRFVLVRIQNSGDL